jgi:hypothetical protein
MAFDEYGGWIPDVTYTTPDTGVVYNPDTGFYELSATGAASVGDVSLPLPNQDYGQNSLSSYATTSPWAYQTYDPTSIPKDTAPNYYDPKTDKWYRQTTLSGSGYEGVDQSGWYEVTGARFDPAAGAWYSTEANYQNGDLLYFNQPPGPGQSPANIYETYAPIRAMDAESARIQAEQAANKSAGGFGGFMSDMENAVDMTSPLHWATGTSPYNLIDKSAYYTEPLNLLLGQGLGKTEEETRAITHALGAASVAAYVAAPAIAGAGAAGGTGTAAAGTGTAAGTAGTAGSLTAQQAATNAVINAGQLATEGSSMWGITTSTIASDVAAATGVDIATATAATTAAIAANPSAAAAAGLNTVPLSVPPPAATAATTTPAVTTATTAPPAASAGASAFTSWLKAAAVAAPLLGTIYSALTAGEISEDQARTAVENAARTEAAWNKLKTDGDAAMSAAAAAQKAAITAQGTGNAGAYDEAARLQSEAITKAAAIQAEMARVSSELKAITALEAADGVIAAVDQNKAKLDQLYSEGKILFDDYIKLGKAGANALLDPNAFQQSQGYQFALDQAIKATERSAAARTGVLNPKTTADINKNIVGLANQDYSNWWARQKGLVDTGQSAVGSVNALSQKYGADYNAQTTYAADVRANAKNAAAGYRATGMTDSARSTALGISGAADATASGINKTADTNRADAIRIAEIDAQLARDKISLQTNALLGTTGSTNQAASNVANASAYAQGQTAQAVSSGLNNASNAFLTYQYLDRPSTSTTYDPNKNYRYINGAWVLA